MPGRPFEPSPSLDFLLANLDLPEATGEPGATWQDFQLEHLNLNKLLAIETKSRQVGWSWTCAAEAVANAALVHRSTSIFVSINMDESKEKVRYAKTINEALARDVRLRMIGDSATEVEYANGSRIISHPCRPVRGKAKANVYLDEFAHYPKDREIYASALPVTSRGGLLRVGSSPLGAAGMFWEIAEQKLRPYPGYWRRSIPWWLVTGLCRNVEAARQQAPAMTTEERVTKFASMRLAEIFENMPLGDYQQEYECATVDEQIAWVPWEIIKANQEGAETLLFWQAHSVEQAFAAIEAMAADLRKIEAAFCGGLDVGRKKDLTEITLLGKGTTGHLPYRLGVSLAGVKFDDQKAVVDRMLERLPVTLLLVDQTGLGMQMAEDLHTKHKARVEGVDFTNERKELWAVELKVRMERRALPLPLDRELVYQVHSIKRKMTEAKNAVFDVDANAKHHADKFWSLALACWAGKGSRKATLRAGWL